MIDRKFKTALKIIADRYSIKPIQITSFCKTKTVTKARSILMWKIRQQGYSLNYIGNLFNKNHATVLLSCRRIDEDESLIKEAKSIDIDLLPDKEELEKKERVYSSNGKWRKLFKKYKAACQICGFEDVVEVHHIIPVKNGGSNEAENILILCSNHHKMLHLGMLYVEKIKPKELVTAS